MVKLPKYPNMQRKLHTLFSKAGQKPRNRNTPSNPTQKMGNEWFQSGPMKEKHMLYQAYTGRCVESLGEPGRPSTSRL